MPNWKRLKNSLNNSAWNRKKSAFICCTQKRKIFPSVPFPVSIYFSIGPISCMQYDRFLNRTLQTLAEPWLNITNLNGSFSLRFSEHTLDSTLQVSRFWNHTHRSLLQTVSGKTHRHFKMVWVKAHGWYPETVPHRTLESAPFYLFS